MKLTLHHHLRTNVMMAWVVAWNALLVGGLLLDQAAGGRHAWFTSAFTLAALGTATLCLAVMLQPRMQELVFHDAATAMSLASVRRELRIFAAVAGACGLIVPVAGLFAR